MSPRSKFEEVTVGYTRWLIKWRYLAVLVSLITAFGAGSGARFLGFDTDYRAFFSKENPQLLAFEAMQNIYTKNDNIMFVVTPKDGHVFTPQTLAAIEELAEEGWKIPFALRVDAVSNFQNTVAEEDDLIVEDLVENGADFSPAELEYARDVALREPFLVNRIISDKAHVTGVNVTVEMPGKALDEVPTAGPVQP